ncbi:hypothetical protein ACFL35_10355, partial [Candidatus Riflebacteria bacterium]
PIQTKMKKFKKTLNRLSFSYEIQNEPEEVNCSDVEIVVITGLGFLNFAYSVSDLCFVGGGFLPGRGGQNPIEPLNFKKPVFFGRHMDHFRWACAPLLQVNGAKMIDTGAFSIQLKKYQTEPQAFTEMGMRGYHLLEENCGNLEKLWQAVMADESQ